MLVASVFLFSSLPVYAKTLVQDDPCNNLSGKWKGLWIYLDGNCHWDMSIDASTYNDEARLVATFSNSSNKRICYPDSAGPIFITGTCKDSRLKLIWHGFSGQKMLSESAVSGQIIGNVLTLEAYGRNGVLNKQTIE